jgi:hypothetical protein
VNKAEPESSVFVFSSIRVFDVAGLASDTTRLQLTVMQAAVVGRPRGDTGKPTYDSVEEFVAANDGKRAIRKVLIANNGIAAVKCMRSVRTWAYETFGDDRAVSGLGRMRAMQPRYRALAQAATVQDISCASAGVPLAASLAITGWNYCDE